MLRLQVDSDEAVNHIIRNAQKVYKSKFAWIIKVIYEGTVQESKIGSDDK